MSTPYMRRRSCWKPLLLAIAAVLALSWLSSLVVTAHMPWYASLNKPDWVFGAAGPALYWVFSTAWPVFYVLMVLAARLAWSHPVRKKKTLVRRGRVLFFIQLALVLAWVPVFFGLENPQYGLICIVPAWLFAVLTCLCYWRLHVVAGVLLVPYLAWLSFVALLNYHLFILN